MNKKLITMLNALLILACCTESINAVNPLEEIVVVGEKSLENAVDNVLVKAADAAPERLAAIVDDLETGMLTLSEAESKQLSMILAQSQAGQLTVNDLKILKPTTLVAILVGLGLITSGGVIAGYLLQSKTEPRPVYDYKYLPQ